MNLHLVLVALLLSFVKNGSAGPVVDGESSSSLRGGGSQLRESRRLWSFFSLFNLLHPPHHHKKSSGSGNGSNGNGENDGEDGESDADDEMSQSGFYYGESGEGYYDASEFLGSGESDGGGGGGGASTNQSGAQSSKRVSSLIAYILGAAAVAGGVVALIYHKPETGTSRDVEDGVVLEDGTIVGSMISGMNNLGSLSFAGPEGGPTEDIDHHEVASGRGWAGLLGFGGVFGLMRKRQTDTEKGEEGDNANDFIEMEDVAAVEVDDSVLPYKGYTL